jgi:flagellar protein FlbT
MSLKISLKPHERIILGGAVLSNGPTKGTIIVENNVPILRQKDIMSEQGADTPCKRIYFVIQLMYIDGKNLLDYHSLYWKLVGDLIKAAPRTVAFVDRISENILVEKYYQALKVARELIQFEEEVTRNVRGSAEGL